MHQNQIENTNTQTAQLKKNLSQFGLHPNDWSLEYFDHSNLLIKNIKEDSFSFIGKTQAKNINDWEFISLASL